MRGLEFGRLSTGDLGQSKALANMETSEGSARVGSQASNTINQGQQEKLAATIKKHRDKAEKEKEDAKAGKEKEDSAKNVGGAGNQPESESRTISK